ncbi:MAG: argininosuccinate lyase [bacterium]|nr:argininosuccinate lyase [bacterium]
MKKKLWQKDFDTNDFLEWFTVGKDRELDIHLAPFDVLGSIAHAKMLAKIGLVTAEESMQLVSGLEEIGKQIEKGNFEIEEGVEDVHSQIELILTQNLGEVGKKIHSGRSRNDQVLTALKLYAKHEVQEVADSVNELFQLLIKLSNEHKNALMPGYTHMQVAMPSSFGLWFGAYAESLIDDLTVLKAAFDVVNKNPLGSAAGYGSSFPLDREMTTKDLGFADLNYNVIYAQMTRGKMEKVVAVGLSTIAGTIAKFAMDVCQYAGQNFNFLKLPDQFTTGSSIMPHKKNPDGFELVRAKCNQVQGLPYELNLILNNLPSGYHRDLQITKEHFIPAFETLKSCIKMTCLMLAEIKINDKLLDNGKYEDMFSVELVNELVLGGMPFRDAYVEVGKRIASGEYKPDKKVNHSHLGSIGNLGNDKIKAAFEVVYDSFK